MKNALTIAANTFREAVRQKLPLLLFIVALLLVASSRYLLGLDLGHEKTRFVFDFGSGASAFFGSLIAIVACSQLIHSEMDNRTIITLLSKPVTRTQFVCGKIMGVWACLILFTATVAAATGGMMFLTRMASALPDGGYSAADFSVFGLAAWGVAQCFKLLTVTAITALVCSVSGSLMFSVTVSGMCLAISLVCSSDIYALSDVPNFMRALSMLFPDFAIYNATDLFPFGGADMRVLAVCAANALIYSAFAAASAVFVFSRREF